MTTNWTFFFSDDSEVVIPDSFLTRQERADLSYWYGSGRAVDVMALCGPTFAEFGDDKANAYAAACSATDRWEACDQGRQIP